MTRVRFARSAANSRDEIGRPSFAQPSGASRVTCSGDPSRAARERRDTLKSAQRRVRELETIIEALNRRLVEPNQRVQTAESHAMAVIGALGLPG